MAATATARSSQSTASAVRESFGPAGDAGGTGGEPWKAAMNSEEAPHRWLSSALKNSPVSKRRVIGDNSESEVLEPLSQMSGSAEDLNHLHAMIVAMDQRMSHEAQLRSDLENQLAERIGGLSGRVSASLSDQLDVMHEQLAEERAQRQVDSTSIRASLEVIRTWQSSGQVEALVRREVEEAVAKSTLRLEERFLKAVLTVDSGKAEVLERMASLKGEVCGRLDAAESSLSKLSHAETIQAKMDSLQKFADSLGNSTRSKEQKEMLAKVDERLLAYREQWEEDTAARLAAVEKAAAEAEAAKAECQQLAAGTSPKETNLDAAALGLCSKADVEALIEARFDAVQRELRIDPDESSRGLLSGGDKDALSTDKLGSITARLVVLEGAMSRQALTDQNLQTLWEDMQALTERFDVAMSPEADHLRKAKTDEDIRRLEMLVRERLVKVENQMDTMINEVGNLQASQEKIRERLAVERANNLERDVQVKERSELVQEKLQTLIDKLSAAPPSEEAAGTPTGIKPRLRKFSTSSNGSTAASKGKEVLTPKEKHDKQRSDLEVTSVKELMMEVMRGENQRLREENHEIRQNAAGRVRPASDATEWAGSRTLDRVKRWEERAQTPQAASTSPGGPYSEKDTHRVILQHEGGSTPPMGGAAPFRWKTAIRSGTFSVPNATAIQVERGRPGSPRASIGLPANSWVGQGVTAFRFHSRTSWPQDASLRMRST